MEHSIEGIARAFDALISSLIDGRGPVALEPRLAQLLIAGSYDELHSSELRRVADTIGADMLELRALLVPAADVPPQLGAYAHFRTAKLPRDTLEDALIAHFARQHRRHDRLG